MDDLDIVASLVQVGVAIKEAGNVNYLEVPDLAERLSRIDDMLVECMSSDALDHENNVVKVFGKKKEKSDNTSSNENVIAAKTFIDGPLCNCIKSKILSIMGTRQVYSDTY